MNNWKTILRPIFAEIVAALIVSSITAVVVALAVKFITWLF